MCERQHRRRRRRPDRVRAHRAVARRCACSTPTAAGPKCPATACAASRRCCCTPANAVSGSVTIETEARRQTGGPTRARRQPADVSHRNGPAGRPAAGEAGNVRRRKRRRGRRGPELRQPAVHPARPAAGRRPVSTAGERARTARVVSRPDQRRVRRRGTAGPGQDSHLGARASVRRRRRAPDRAPSLVAAAAFGGAARDATVVAPGGPQRVEWRDEAST